MEFYRQLRRMQNRIDVSKYYEGLKEDSDPCGSYDYCVNCNKDLMDPCARAQIIYIKRTMRSDKMLWLRKLPRK